LKRCIKCGAEKATNAFNRNCRTRDGLEYRCKACRAAYYRQPEVCARTRAKAIKRRQLNGGKAFSYRPEHRYTFAKSRAKKYGRVFDIERAVYDRLIQNPCTYCGGVLGMAGVGLDRADNARGYTLDNVRPCCGECNRIKSNVFTYEEMRVIGSVIADIKRARLEKSA
jgi:hypothetical protein